MENKCPHCGSDLPKSAAFCMHCFSVINPKVPPLAARPSHKRFPITVITVCLALLLLSSATAFTLTKRPAPALSESIASESVAETDSAPDTEPSTENMTDAAGGAATTETVTSAVDMSATAPANTPTHPQAAIPANTTMPTTTQTLTTAKTTTQKSTTAKSKEAAPDEVLISSGTLTYYPADKKDRSYTIPYNVTAISRNAFKNTYLQTLTFSKREHLSCDWENLFAGLPNLKTIYIYAGTDADTQGMHYFDGEIIYYYE